MDALCRKVLADDRIAPFFSTVDMERQIAMQKALFRLGFGRTLQLYRQGYARGS
jgi:hypothetical protein